MPPRADELRDARERTAFAWQRAGLAYLMYAGLALALAAHRDELVLGAIVAAALAALGLLVGRQQRVEVTLAATVATAVLAALLVVNGS